MNRCLHFVRGLHTKGLLYVMHSPHFYSDSSAGCSGTLPLVHSCKSVGYIDGIGRYCFAKPCNCWLASNNVCNMQLQCHRNYIKSTIKLIFPLFSVGCCTRQGIENLLFKILIHHQCFCTQFIYHIHQHTLRIIWVSALNAATK